MRRMRRVWLMMGTGLLVAILAAGWGLDVMADSDATVTPPVPTPWSAVRSNEDARPLTLVADPTFDREQLPPLTRAQYDRLWRTLNNPNLYPPVEPHMAAGDVYWVARAGDQHVTALSLALRATGDPALVEEICRLFQVVRGALKDTNGDGFLNLTLQNRCDTGETAEILCWKDTSDLEEALVFGSLSHWTYILWANRDLAPRYAEAADFGVDFLVNHHLAKWSARNPSQPVYRRLDKSLYHSYSAVMRGYYYLSLMTGERRYYREAERRADLLMSGMEPLGQTWVFNHRVPGLGEPLYPHPTPYALHTFGMWTDLALEGFGPFGVDDNMSRWTATLRDNMLAGVDFETRTMPHSITGEGAGDVQLTKLTISDVPAMALWDNTGEIVAIALEAQQRLDPNERQVAFPGSLTLVFAVQEGYATRIFPREIDWAAYRDTQGLRVTVRAEERATSNPGILPSEDMSQRTGPLTAP